MKPLAQVAEKSNSTTNPSSWKMTLLNFPGTLFAITFALFQCAMVAFLAVFALAGVDFILSAPGLSWWRPW